MVTFLGETARWLLNNFGTELSNKTILFSGQRAARFFSNELKSIINRPIWEPNYTTIDRLMYQISGLESCDHIVAVAKLYEVYAESVTKSEVLTLEPFDKFYAWGEKLLASFDMVDKYMVDAKMLFCNISDLKEIDADNSYLDERQREIIKRFFLGINIAGKQSVEKSRFVSIWNLLYEIYTNFRKSLSDCGLSYSGMVYRQVAEAVKRGEVDLDEQFIIIGFNALSTSEKILFDYLKNQGALFFWDYDNYYVKSDVQEAGLFLRENIKRYPTSGFAPPRDNFLKPKSMQVVSAPTDSLQCKYVNTFLEDLHKSDQLRKRRTAIVLTDESLLLPVLNSIPDCVEKVNVTMGYPLRATTEYALVERLLTLQLRSRTNKFYHKDVKGILNNPLVNKCSDGAAEVLLKELYEKRKMMIESDSLGGSQITESIFRQTESIDQLTDYIIDILCIIGYNNQSDLLGSEVLSNIVDCLYKLRNSIRGIEKTIDRKLYISLILSMLRCSSVPFKSDSTSGVQIMGILETRNLDFDNVLILSMNDDSFPGNLSNGNMLIPYSLLETYGLPTAGHHEGVYAYYFYRLLQRASRVDMVYCAKADDRRTGERSRYISQLIFEDSWHKITHINMVLNISLCDQRTTSAPKSAEIVEQLRNMSFSPSALNTYITCPYKFYLSYVKQLKSGPEDFDDEVDNRVFGNIIHSSMEYLYRPISKLPFDEQQSQIGSLIGTKKVVDAVNRAVAKHILGDTQAQLDGAGGDIIVVRDIAVSYLNKNILPYDVSRASFAVKAVEHKVDDLTLDIPEVGVIKFRGIVDRLDALADGRLRVIDYKTGERKLSFGSVEDLFTGEHDSSAAFQVVLYSLLISHDLKQQVQPEVYQISKMNGQNHRSDIAIQKSTVHYIDSKLASEFIDNLSSAIFKPMMDSNLKFEPTDKIKRCEFCDFKNLCNR